MSFLLFMIGILLTQTANHLTLGLTIGSNVSESFRVNDNRRLYINTARPALGNGTVSRLNYCYYGESNTQSETYQTLVAIYRPVVENNALEYERIVKTITLFKRTSGDPNELVPQGDLLLSRFNCDSYQLEESVEVLVGDVIGACIYTTSDTERLNLVSQTDEGYTMRFLRAENTRCQDGVIPEVVVDGRLRNTDNRILHLFAEIVSAEVFTTSISTTTTPRFTTTVPTNEPIFSSLSVFIGTTVGVVLSGVLLVAVLCISFLLIIFTVTRRRRRRRRREAVASNNRIRKQNDCNGGEFEDTNFGSDGQNFLCYYEQIPASCSSPQHAGLNMSNQSLSASNILYANYNAQNSGYEMHTLSTLTLSGCFLHEGPNYAYDDVVEMNIIEDIYSDVAPFVQPANSKVDLYAQINSLGIQNIDRSAVQISGHLGSGRFGSVERGIVTIEDQGMQVALKTLNNSTTEEDQLKFLQEAAIMAQFRHPNVVLLYGIVSKSEPITMVEELVEKGDLRNYLLTMRPRSGEIPDSNLPNLLLTFSQHVALGMQYLSSKGFVHRDLAARNILVSMDNFCKVADFGMSRDLANDKYYVSHGGLIPIKWTAPEAIHHKKYSSASDVWSYGCLLYEIWSVGHKPYETLSNMQAVRFINRGKRLSPPPGCPQLIYDLMIQCWNPNKAERPNFRTMHLNLLDNGRNVLSIPSEALESHSLAGVLGAPLTAGEGMFLELQKRYEEVAYYDNII